MPSPTKRITFFAWRTFGWRAMSASRSASGGDEVAVARLGHRGEARRRLRGRRGGEGEGGGAGGQGARNGFHRIAPVRVREMVGPSRRTALLRPSSATATDPWQFREGIRVAGEPPRARPAGAVLPIPSLTVDPKRTDTMPKVLISDELSDAAVQIFRDRGVEVDFQPKLGKDPARLAEIIGNYDGLAIRSATKVTADLIAKADNLRVIGRAGIGVDNVDIPAASRQGHRGDEHALRQLDHHRRACDRDDVRLRPADPGRRRLDPGGQVGEVEVHGRRDHRQDPRPDRRGNIGSVVAAARDRAEDEGDRLRSLPLGRARAGARHRADRGGRRPARPRRLRHACTCRRPRRPRTSSRPSGSPG